MPDRALLAKRERLPRVARFAGSRSVFILLVLSVALLLTTIGAFAIVSVEGAEIAQRVERTQQTQAVIDRLTVSNERFETGRRGYLISGSASFRDVAARSLEDFRGNVVQLARLVTDDPAQSARMERVHALQDERERLLAASVGNLAAYRARNFGDFENERGVRNTREIRAIIDDMARAEVATLAAQTGSQSSAIRLVFSTGGLALLMLVVVLIAVVVLVLRYNRALTSAQTLLRQANEDLEQNVAARTAALSRAERELRETNARLETLLGEVHHRVANSLQMVSVFVSMQAAQTADNGCRAALEETIGRIQAVSQVHRKLYTSKQTDRIALEEYLETLVEDLETSVSSHGQRLAVALQAEPVTVAPDAAVSIGVIVSELVNNAAKYAFEPGHKGRIEVGLRREGTRGYTIEVRDDGRGFDGGEEARGTGLGMRIVDAMARSLKSELRKLETENGACFALTVPG